MSGRLDSVMERNLRTFLSRASVFFTITLYAYENNIYISVCRGYEVSAWLATGNDRKKQVAAESDSQEGISYEPHRRRRAVHIIAN